MPKHVLHHAYHIYHNDVLAWFIFPQQFDWWFRNGISSDCRHPLV